MPTIEESPAPESALVTVVHQSGLELESQQKLIGSFQPLFDQAEEWRQKVATIKITDVTQTREMRLARETRLALKEIRVKADKTRKALKEDVLRRGKCIDGVYNTLAFLIEPLEEHLLAQEQFAERKEAERKAQLKIQREELLRPFGVDTSVYLLDAMSDETFANLLAGTKAAAEAKIEAARKAEEERVAREAADLADRERIRLENERLKAEAEAARVEAARVAKEAADKERQRQEAEEAERRRHAEELAEQQRKAKAEAEAAIKAEREAAAERERIASEKARVEREQIEASAKAERLAAEEKAESARKIALEAAAKDREAREKAEAELHEQREAEERRRKAEALAKKKAAAAGDKAKLVAAADAVDKATPTLKDQQIQERVLHLFHNLIQQLKQEHDAL